MGFSNLAKNPLPAKSYTCYRFIIFWAGRMVGSKTVFMGTDWGI